MESPIQPLPADRLVPAPHPRRGARRRAGDTKHPSRFQLSDGAVGPSAGAEDEEDEPRLPSPHEDGVGERLDITA